MSKILLVLGVILLGLVVAPICVAADAAAKGPGAPNAEKLFGWRLGCQAYSFNKFTFFEAVDKTAQAGLKYIEAYPGQKLSADLPNSKFDQDMSDADIAAAKAKLDSAGVKLVNYGVVGPKTNDEAGWRALFDFAKKMGVETIVSEPANNAFDILDKLTEEYKINIAIHNHPKPSHYWNPDVFLAAVKDHSKRIGACADTGHWMRSGVDPLEALKKCEGRIISFHFKDLNEFGNRDAHDVPFGTGKANVKALLTEIKRQGIKAVFSIEYEWNWENSVPEITESAINFDKIAQEIAK